MYMKYENIQIARESLYTKGYRLHHRATARKYQYDICGAFFDYGIFRQIWRW